MNRSDTMAAIKEGAGYTVYEVDLSDACTGIAGDDGQGRDETDSTMYVGTKREAERHAATARKLVRKYLAQYAAWERTNDGELDEDEADEWMEDEPPTPSLGDRALEICSLLVDRDSAIRVYRIRLRDTTPRQLALHLLDPRTNGGWQRSRTLVGSWPLLRRGGE